MYKLLNREVVRQMKTRHRLLISFIVALFLLGLAVPRLPMYGTTIEFGFSILWLAFCLLVIAANFHALLRLGRGETVEKPMMTKEQREAIKRIQRYKPRRVPSK